MQTYRPALLEEGLYYSDGQIQDEVYEYGSFLQSKMHAAGVSCTDCHDPHSLQVKGSVDRVCMACHAAEKFDTPSHHFHRAGSAGARCVSCHMPTRNYMVVHARHDHSFRIPRPDLDAALGTPDACTQCHTDRSSAWAAAAAQRWWGERARPAAPYGEAIQAGREDRAGASALLAQRVQDAKEPAIRRATAATLLRGGPAENGALEKALADPDPLVRYGAVLALRGLEPAARVTLAAPVLRDPIRAVRIEAARALAAAPPDALSPSDRSELERGIAEYIASQRAGCRPGRGAREPGSSLCRARRRGRGRGRVPACDRDHARPGGRLCEPRRPLPGPGTREGIRSDAAPGARGFPGRCRPPPHARALSRPPEAPGRGARRAAPGRRPRARPGALRVRVCGRARRRGPDRPGDRGARGGLRKARRRPRDRPSARVVLGEGRPRRRSAGVRAQALGPRCNGALRERFGDLDSNSASSGRGLSPGRPPSGRGSRGCPGSTAAGSPGSPR